MKQAEQVWNTISNHLGGVVFGAVQGLQQDGNKEGFTAAVQRVQSYLPDGTAPDNDRIAQAYQAALTIQDATRAEDIPSLVEFTEPNIAGYRCLEGPVATALMARLSLEDAFEAASHWKGLVAESEPCRDFLANLGWWDARNGGLTEMGNVAALISPQYYYTASYLPLFSMVSKLVRGDTASLERIANDEHIRRDIDIAASTRVFAASCRQPLLEIIRPIFDAPLAEQPDVLVDTGCGEGTFLTGMYEDILIHTLRGQHIDEHPLTLVGADPSPVSQRKCEENLASLNIPHHVVYGDIADPDALMQELADRELHPETMLHLNKSTFHNRRLTCTPDDMQQKTPISGNVFTWNGGELVPPGLAECDLLQVLHRWKPYLRNHGMLAIEAHTVDSAGVIREDFLPILAGLELTHALSGQYLLEAHVFMDIFAAAGLTSTHVHTTGDAIFGAPLMTMGHYKLD